MMRHGLAAVASLLVTSGPVATLADAPEHNCAAKVPASLVKRLSTDFPGYHVAEPAEYDPEDVERRKKEEAGDPCFSVAAADVDGDGTLDYGLIIAGPQGVLLVAARDVGNKGWEVSRLSELGPNEKPNRGYVDPLDAGSYQDIYATDKGPSDYVPEPGRVPKFKAKRAGFVAGTIEATAVGYFFTSKGWVHLQLGD
jgi:hypothetical protein